MEAPRPNHTRPSAGLMRTASAEGVNLRHPTPDLQTMHGAYVKNIEKLEQSADELSQGGSDIGEEIRKMKQEQDRASASRRSSLASREGREGREGIREGRLSISTSALPPNRSRNHSTSSYANSIVDVNSAARWGGYSPGGYITSPSVSRVSSFHRPTGLPEPVQEGRPLDSPLASPSSYFPPTRRPSQQSMARTNEDMSVSEHLEPHDETKEEHESQDEEWELMRRQHAEDDLRPEARSLDNDESDYDAAERHGSLPQQHDQTVHSEKGTPDKHNKDDLHPSEDFFNSHDGPDLRLHEGPFDDHHVQDLRPDEGLLNDHDEFEAAKHHGNEYRSSTPDTYRQARNLFKDFDGVHFSPTTEEFVELDQAGNEVNRLSSNEFQQQVMQQQQQPLQPRMNPNRLSRPMSYAYPPPGENMTYYPAPVPRMLNLPKRLSQLPAANVQAQRRSQVVSGVPAPADNRKSAPWLPALEFQSEEEAKQPEPAQQETQAQLSPQLSPPQNRQRHSMMNPRLSRMSMAGMPAQLRASVFFEQPAVQQQDVHVTSDSAVATLDSILAASVNAPVNSFMDHPFAGPTREIYGRAPPTHRQSQLVNFAKSADTAAAAPEDSHKRTTSSGTTGRPVVQKRNSIASMLTDLGNPSGNKLKKRNSKMSLATDLGLSKADEGATPSVHQRTTSGHSQLQNSEREGEESSLAPEQDIGVGVGAEDDEDNYEDRVFDERETFFAQPTTLLAELQLRKAQQKTRNRNGAADYPQGMHSTLLQMDAVAQIEKKKRQGQRTRLAWEDPMQLEVDQHLEDENDEVPLGVLFPEKQGLINRGRAQPGGDWDKPLGLLERRELEDNEPLARRRNRLRGVSPDHHLRMHAQQQALLRQQEAQRQAEAVPLPDEEEDEHANEPLAERLRRLKRKEALNAALGDLAGGDESKSMLGFTDEILNQFDGTADDKDKVSEVKPEDSPATNPPATDDPVAGAQEPEEEQEGETLGQRRARLQREKAQRNVSDPQSLGAVRPQLKTSVSLANLLAVHPISANATGYGKAEPVAGSLLAASSKAETEARKKLLEQNARSTSYNLPPRPTVAPTKSTSNLAAQQGFTPAPAPYSQQQQMQAQQMALPQQQQQQQMYPQMAAGMGVMGQNQMQYPPQYGYAQPQQMYPNFAQPTAYAGMNMGLPNGGVGLLQQQQMYGQMSGMQNYNTGMGAGVGAHLQRAMADPYAGYDEMQLSQGQRDLIDRWRLSVAQ